MSQPTSQQVLEKIKQEHIAPKSKWQFLLKDAAIWSAFSVATVTGGLATSVIIFLASASNVAPADDAGSFSQRLLLGLPHFWLLLLLGFLGLAYYNARHTKSGYRYSPYLIVVASVVISSGIGYVGYASGGGELLEEAFYQQVPFYQQLIHRHGRLLLAPEHGQLAGVIIDIQPGYLLIRDFRGTTWRLPTTTDRMGAGQRVRISGELSEDGVFIPQIVLPWFNTHHPPVQIQRLRWIQEHMGSPLFNRPLPPPSE